MRLIIKPILEPDRSIDITDRVIGVIAEELGQRYGGPVELNVLEAERDLELAMNAAFGEDWSQSLASPADAPRDKAMNRS